MSSAKPTGTPFLTARWLDLGLVTWRIPAELVRGLLPPGLEPDRRDRDGGGDGDDVAYVSYVAFRFVDTRVKGIAVPWHTDFPEVNLRTYVREVGGARRRGVLFIAELVPKIAIATVANVLYHEHYRAVPMHCEVEDVGDLRRMTMVVTLGERDHTMTIAGRRETEMPAPDSDAHFFKEHEWGFGRDAEGGPVVYRVWHPQWRVYPTAPEHLALDVDFGELYGAPWGVLDRSAPCHVAFAVGSEIAVFGRED